jgi:hypothetical protein
MWKAESARHVRPGAPRQRDGDTRVSPAPGPAAVTAGARPRACAVGVGLAVCPGPETRGRAAGRGPRGAGLGGDARVATGGGRGTPRAHRAQSRRGGQGVSRRSTEPKGNTCARERGGEWRVRRKFCGGWVRGCAGVRVCGGSEQEDRGANGRPERRPREKTLRPHHTAHECKKLLYTSHGEVRLGAELDGTGGRANARPERRRRRNKQAARETICGHKTHERKELLHTV